MSLRDLVPPAIRAMSAYQIPHPAGITVRLDANESPYDLPAEIASELAGVLAKVSLNRYPDGPSRALRKRVAADVGCDPAQLCFGNGSDELIQLIIATFGHPHPAGIAYPVPSFVVYRIASVSQGAKPVEIPLAADFTLDVAALDAALETERPNIIFFALPNNPTGTLWPRAEVLRVAKAYPGMLVIADEAYFDYSQETLFGELSGHPNLVLMRTFSKIGLAALRCGYLIAAPEIITEIEKIRPPYNVGSLNQLAVAWLLEHHPGVLRDPCAQIISERERVSAALAKIPDLQVFPSRANFVLVRHPRATVLWTQLCEAGILVRNFDRPGPLAGCLRITIGTPQENTQLLSAISQ